MVGSQDPPEIFYNPFDVWHDREGIWREICLGSGLCLSKIFLAFDSMPHIKKSMSARMYTAVGCGAFYMCQHVAGIEDVLLPGREIVTFHSDDEMIDMIRYYLKRDEERRRISEAGRSRVLTDHTYEVRTGQMMDVVLKNL